MFNLAEYTAELDPELKSIWVQFSLKWNKIL